MQTCDELIYLTRVYQNSFQINDNSYHSSLNTIITSYPALSSDERMKYLGWLYNEMYAFNFPGVTYQLTGSTIGGMIPLMIADYLMEPFEPVTIIRYAITSGIGFFAGNYIAENLKKAHQIRHLCQSPHATHHFMALSLIGRELNPFFWSPLQLKDFDEAYVQFEKRQQENARTENAALTTGRVHTL